MTNSRKLTAEYDSAIRGLISAQLAQRRAEDELLTLDSETLRAVFVPGPSSMREAVLTGNATTPGAQRGRRDDGVAYPEEGNDEGRA